MHRHRQFAYTARKRRKADHLGKALNAKEVPKLITLQVFLSRWLQNINNYFARIIAIENGGGGVLMETKNKKQKEVQICVRKRKERLNNGEEELELLRCFYKRMLC